MEPGSEKDAAANNTSASSRSHNNGSSSNGNISAQSLALPVANNSYAQSGDKSGNVSLKNFKQLALLGEGAYSAVYKILRLSDNKIYALKKVKLPSLSEKEKQNSLNEVRLLASVQHEHVVSYKESFYDDPSKCLCINLRFFYENQISIWYL